MAYQSFADSRQADVEQGGWAGDDAELRLILVGKSGGGKSATGNTILGRKEFESAVSAKTTTLRCQRGQGSWQGTAVYVVDTPGLLDTDDYTEIMRREILACVNLSRPGPHALILVTRVGGFPAEDAVAAKCVWDIFGPESARHTVVLFTCVENLGGTPLQEYVRNTDNRDLQELIRRCGHRFCGFNNGAVGAERARQVSELMAIVRRTVIENGGRHYVNRLYLEPNLRDAIVQVFVAENRNARKMAKKAGWSRENIIVAAITTLCFVVTSATSVLRGDPGGERRRRRQRSGWRSSGGPSREAAGVAESPPPPPIPEGGTQKLPDRRCEIFPEMSGNIQGPERRIVLVGKTGNGKSAVSNTILGSPVFESKMSFGSVTQTCQRAEAEVNGRKVVVVDTPGFLDTARLERETSAEVSKCIEFCMPGPHVILQVMRPGRFTKEEEEVARLIKEVFSLKAKDYTIILFTRKEDLEDKTLEEFITEGNAVLKEQVYHCGNRFLAFNNKAKGAEREAQVRQLMAMIDALVEKNRAAPCYTEEMMKADKEHLAENRDFS